MGMEDEEHKVVLDEISTQGAEVWWVGCDSRSYAEYLHHVRADDREGQGEDGC